MSATHDSCCCGCGECTITDPDNPCGCACICERVMVVFEGGNCFVEQPCPELNGSAFLEYDFGIHGYKGSVVLNRGQADECDVDLDFRFVDLAESPGSSTSSGATGCALRFNSAALGIVDEDQPVTCAQVNGGLNIVWQDVTTGCDGGSASASSSGGGGLCSVRLRCRCNIGTGCCPSIPSILHGTIQAASGCSCLDGAEFTLRFDPHFDCLWSADIPLTDEGACCAEGQPQGALMVFDCGENTFDCTGVKVGINVCDNKNEPGTRPQPAQPPESCSCDPYEWSFVIDDTTGGSDILNCDFAASETPSLRIIITE